MALAAAAPEPAPSKSDDRRAAGTSRRRRAVTRDSAHGRRSSAGGRGTRLAPYTSVLPKPLMPIGDRAILEIVVDQLAASGFTSVTFCVGYLSHLIQAVFDTALRQATPTSPTSTRMYPLGTAGPLRLVDGLDSTFFVMNGDVLTTLDYRRLLRSHRPPGTSSRSRRSAPRSRSTTGSCIVHGIDGPAAPRHRLRGEAGDRVRRQHGGLRARAARARVHPPGRATSTSPIS